MKIEINSPAPYFEGLTSDGSQITSNDFKNKKLIIFFYPKDNTPGCTAEACNLQENYEVLKKKGYEIIGVSADTTKQHVNFSKKYNLTYPLIADTDKKMISDFGVWGPKKFMGREFDGILRTTYIVNEKGIVTHRFDKVKTKEHAAQILAEID